MICRNACSDIDSIHKALVHPVTHESCHSMYSYKINLLHMVGKLYTVHQKVYANDRRIF